jgi:hypothetical protein
MPVSLGEDADVDASSILSATITGAKSGEAY